MLAGHAALSTTQRYIEADVEAQRKVPARHLTLQDMMSHILDRRSA
jgi:hypothetical protein